jgi:hypothetical protein
LAPQPIEIIGEPLLAKDPQGQPFVRIATVFPKARVIVTVPGIHATQRAAFVDYLNEECRKRAQPALTREESDAAWADAVDLILQGADILIRPDPLEMDLAHCADEMLQELVSKCHIKFLYTTDRRVRQAIKQRGECWRIVPLPATADQMQAMILRAAIAVGGRRIYYYNAATGTHFLTAGQFAGLAQLGDTELSFHLREIKDLAGRCNRLGCPELAFFGAPDGFAASAVAGADFAGMDGAQLRRAHGVLKDKFEAAVPPELRRDDPANLEWRNRLFAALTGAWEGEVPEESLLGLSPEFFMQIEWLPSARIEEGELLFDSVYAEAPGPDGRPADLLGQEEMIRGFVFNFFREFSDLEYVNIGRVMTRLVNRPATSERRDVFLAELKRSGMEAELVHVLRLAKWGVGEQLDEGNDLLQAMLRADDYIDYVLDRRLGCRQLGMNLPWGIRAHRIAETYHGRQERYHGTRLWSTYFERDYVRGIASSRLPAARLENPAYAVQLARLLGQAAAPNLIVGRADAQGKVIFDDGDEVVIEDESGLPVELTISDPTGAFTRYNDALADMAPSYAAPVERRREGLVDVRAFAEAYLQGLTERYTTIRQEYHRRQRGFDTLFKHRPQDPGGAFGYRWLRVLARLDATEPQTFTDVIRATLRL